MGIKKVILLFLIINFVKCKTVPYYEYCKPYWIYYDFGGVIEARIDLMKDTSVIKHTVEIEIHFFQKHDYSTGFQGANLNWISKDGDRLKLQVAFPTSQNDIPEIISIKLNEKEICRKPSYEYNNVGIEMTLSKSFSYQSSGSIPTNSISTFSNDFFSNGKEQSPFKSFDKNQNFHQHFGSNPTNSLSAFSKDFFSNAEGFNHNKSQLLSNYLANYFKTSTTPASLLTNNAVKPTNKPTIIVTKNPAIRMTNKPVIRVTNKPVITSTNKPVITSTNKPVITSTYKPVITSTNKPVNNAQKFISQPVIMPVISNSPLTLPSTSTVVKPSKTPTIIYNNKPVTNTQVYNVPTPVAPTTTNANYVTIKPKPVIPVKPNVAPLPMQPEEDQEESLNEICGIPKISQMLVNGKPTKRGEFPWLSIIYRREGVANLLFHCTGTLISDQHVVTAGHCIETPKTTYGPKDFISVLGKYNLLSWTEQGGYISNIRSVYLHPDYRIKNNEGLYADIGVLRLERKLSFSPFIKPICLWNKSTSLDGVVGKIGTTVGWSNGATDILGEPLKAEFPIVSNEDCLASNPSFYYLVNNKTFCAGDRSGTGPCLGDSGSGFYLRDGVRWYLRGVVSLALEDRSKNCDLYSFFVFTDAASVMQWLNNFINQ